MNLTSQCIVGPFFCNIIYVHNLNFHIKFQWKAYSVLKMESRESSSVSGVYVEYTLAGYLGCHKVISDLGGW